MPANWGFYGRSAELRQLEGIFARKRFFFVKVTGRRRIGKTTLINEALRANSIDKIFYLQIPDSGPAGVISAAHDALDTFGVTEQTASRPHTLDELAGTITKLARAGYVVALDEFQYFTRERLTEFTSFLQREIDALIADAANCPGGIIVLGSIHAEIQALLDDKDAPLFHRTTDELNLSHLDIASVMEILRAHSEASPERLLFMWTLFEGVPKFYRDCFEQGVLGADRRTLLKKMFFESSSPLRTEADNWFLKELRGRYDVVLKYVAKNPGSGHADVQQHVKNTSRDEQEQVAGYLKILIDRYGLIEKKLPVFAKPKARGARYYLKDNFLTAWLAALANQVSALAFSPVEKLVENADARLFDVEGHALEKLVAQLYEERSRKGVGDFALTSRITGYWNSSDTEIDLVALDDEKNRVRLGTSKRSGEKLRADIASFKGHVERFNKALPSIAGRAQELVGFTVRADDELREFLKSNGLLCQDLRDLTSNLE